MSITARCAFTKGHGSEPFRSWFGFAPNGATSPVISGASSTLVGPMKNLVTSITYSATGLQTILFGTSVKFPGNAAWSVGVHWTGTIWHANFKAAYSNTTRTLVVQQYSGALVAYEVAANADNLIRVFLDADLTDTN